MKKSILFIVFFCIQSLFAQSTIAFKPLRYDEDYRHFSFDSTAGFYSKMKNSFLDHSKQLSISVGGEVRNQYQFFENENWGNAAIDSDGFLLNRALFHLDLKLNNKFRMFIQLQSSSSLSRINPNSVERNELDIHQLFLDYYFNTENAKMTIRLGRQEVLFGSQRLVSVREGPNSRRAFDGIKWNYDLKNSSLSAFYLQAVVNVPNIFDDKITYSNKLYGTYNVFKKMALVHNIDLYFLGNYIQKAQYSNVAGTENRYSLGTRIWNNTPTWSYDLEAVYQFGNSNGQTISAYTLSSNTSYAFSKTKIGLKTELVSGDDKKDDHNLNTFNPLFPKGAYFGLAALIGPENLIDIHPYMEHNITRKVVMGLDYDFFWRYSLNDGIYGAKVKPIFNNTDSNHRNIGTQLGLNFDYKVNPFLDLVIEGTWFNTGQYIKEVSAGKDIFFTAFTLQFKF
ncbi:hypothetical protein HNQ02_000709 [Flavobacterium sp. 7E]|uniref:alginate export family protein n=1 Tax=Flavobacterium sp. 7E TaxID=2735898 RepID=UPI00156EBBED|nr:alginate export family protein [Flavobacterium sp. 7E]NRS87802.1 hypothetical protein [Flavobacterium sp. 7E]